MLTNKTTVESLKDELRGRIEWLNDRIDWYETCESEDFSQLLYAHFVTRRKCFLEVIETIDRLERAS